MNQYNLLKGHARSSMFGANRTTKVSLMSRFVRQQTKLKPTEQVQAPRTSGRSTSPDFEEGPASDSILALQRLHGNQFVQGLMNRAGPGLQIQRFKDRATWVTDSTVTGIRSEYIRSAELLAIDDAVGAYEPLRHSGDLQARELALNAIDTAVQQWRFSKRDVTGKAKKPSMTKKRSPAIQALVTEVRQERDAVIALQNQARNERTQQEAEQRDQFLETLIPEAVRTLPDKGERARAIFDLYMQHFRGTASYSLKTVPEASMFNGAGTIACATISGGLRDVFRYAGLTSAVIQIPARYFITKPLGNSFMDSAAVGNVFMKGTDKDFAAVKRFFFSGHWIVEAKDAGLFFDPTSGVPVSADGSEIIDPKYTDFVPDGMNYKKGETLTLTTHLDAAQSGSAYELSEK
ncbi:MAG: hypothetical protein ABI782_05435 [Anaerolineaceae bacterium]